MVAGVTLDKLAALGAAVEAAMALLREDAVAIERSGTALEQTTVERRQDVTRLREAAFGGLWARGAGGADGTVALSAAAIGRE